MRTLLEFREKLKAIYSRYDSYIISMIKFMLAFFAINMINGNMGYMKQIDNLAIVLIVSLLCSFLPNGCIIFFSALFSLLHMYALSIEVALVGLGLYLIMFLLYFRFSPKDSLVVLLTPMLCAANIPYVIPIAMGLLGTPASAVSVGCGVVIYYFLSNVVANAQVISAMEAEEAIAKLKLMLDVLIDNKPMMVMIVAFAVTVIVVYLIRRLPIAYSWTIAIVTGSIVDLVILLVGDLKFNTKLSLFGAIMGSFLAVAVAMVIEFFRFCVDYNRAERVQFEDDEYYYYVKAIPKMTLAAQTKTVKKINTQRRSAASGSATGQGTRAKHPGEAGDGREEGGRIVVTERIPNIRGLRGEPGNDRRVGGKSVTINSNMVDEERIEDIMDDVMEEETAGEYAEDGLDYAGEEGYSAGESYGDGLDYAGEEGYETGQNYEDDQSYAGEEGYETGQNYGDGLDYAGEDGYETGQNYGNGLDYAGEDGQKAGPNYRNGRGGAGKDGFDPKDNYEDL